MISRAGINQYTLDAKVIISPPTKNIHELNSIVPLKITKKNSVEYSSLNKFGKAVT
jgi:hypothetical protein